MTDEKEKKPIIKKVEKLVDTNPALSCKSAKELVTRRSEFTAEQVRLAFIQLHQG